MPRDKAYFIHTCKHGFINKLTITSKEKPSKCAHSVCSRWQAFISVYYQTKQILCMLLTLDPSKYWLILQLCLRLFEYVCFHLCQGLLRRKKLQLLCGVYLLAGRGILKAAQHSSCFEIHEAGWLDKYSLHIDVVNDLVYLHSQHSALTHWYPSTFTASLMDAVESMKREGGRQRGR